MSQHQPQQNPAPAEQWPTDDVPHVMSIEHRHRQREHYEALAREATTPQQK